MNKKIEEDKPRSIAATIEYLFWPHNKCGDHNSASVREYVHFIDGTGIFILIII